MPKLKEHKELNGKTVKAEGKTFKVQHCYGGIFNSPYKGSLFFKDHGKYMYRFFGHKSNGDFVRVDVFDYELIDEGDC